MNQISSKQIFVQSIEFLLEDFIVNLFFFWLTVKLNATIFAYLYLHHSKPVLLNLVNTKTDHLYIITIIGV